MDNFGSLKLFAIISDTGDNFRKHRLAIFYVYADTIYILMYGWKHKLSALFSLLTRGGLLKTAVQMSKTFCSQHMILCIGATRPNLVEQQNKYSEIYHGGLQPEKSQNQAFLRATPRRVCRSSNLKVLWLLCH